LDTVRPVPELPSQILTQQSIEICISITLLWFVCMCR